MASKPPSRPFSQQLQDALPQGVVVSEGWRRLSAAIGVIIAAPVLVIFLYIVFSDPYWSTRPSDVAAVQQKGIQVSEGLAFLKMVVGGIATIIAFAVPWALLQTIGWIVEGFKKGASAMSNSRPTANPQHVRAMVAAIEAAIIDYCNQHPGQVTTGDIAESFIAEIASFLMQTTPPGPNHRDDVIRAAEAFCHKALGVISAIATDAP